MKYFSRILVCLAEVILISLPARAQLKVAGGNEKSFGNIYQTGALVHKSFTIENVGQDTITISKINTSCGCTAALISDSILAPGQKSEVKVQFNPTGYIGEVTKYVYVLNSYPKSRLLTVKMTGHVRYALQPTPNWILFSNAKAGQRDSASVTLSNTSNETIRITKVELPSKVLTYRLHKWVLKPGEFTDLDLYIRKKTNASIDGYVRILTTSKLQPVLELRTFAGILGGGR